MIDKVFPRKLNTSKDARVRGKDEMIDAVNVTIDDNYDESGDNATGNFGVLKPIKGNVSISNPLSEGTYKVLGSCVDDRNDDIYYFVFAENNPSKSGVYKYSSDSNNVTEVFTSKYLNFRPNFFIDADIVYIPNTESSVDFKLKPIIFFTDNYNEPKKLDLSRIDDAIALNDSDSIFLYDFISVCPRTPSDPPTATFENDPNSSVSNFKGEKGFQFAYQNIYKSGDVSAISTYSQLYVPSAYINQGAQPNPSFFSENLLRVNIPQASVGPEVNAVRLLVRSGNTGNWFIVDEVENTNTSQDIKIDFRNDKVLTLLPIQQAKKQYDAVPKKARAQSVTNNRLFYGNYVEGFDLTEVSANISHQFLPRPQDFISYSLDLIPEIRNANTNINPSNCVNRLSAYRLDTSNLANTTEANTQIIFNITLSPDNNFHFYESRIGYHGSAHLNVMKSNLTQQDRAETTNQQVSSDFDSSGRAFFAEMPSQGFDVGEGYSRTDLAQNPYTSSVAQWDAEFSQDEQPIEACYGTSAANPFIIQGKALQFSGSFVTLVELNREQLSSIIRDMIVGNYGRDSSLFASGVDAAGNDISIPRVQIISVSSEDSYQINLSISNLEKLKVYGNTDERARLVNAVGDRSLLELGSKHLPPMGYFIVNYANPTFRLKDISQFYALDAYGQADDSFFALDLVDLGNYDFMTCVPDVKLDEINLDQDISTSNLFNGWVCMTPSYIKFVLPNVSQEAISSIFSNCGDEIYDIIQNNGDFYYGAWEGNGTVRESYDIASSYEPIIKKQISRWLGGLIPADAVPQQVSSAANQQVTIVYNGGRLINTFQNFAEDLERDGIELSVFDSSYFLYSFTLLDGEAGCGAKRSDDVSGQSQSSVSYSTIVAGVSPWFHRGENGTIFTASQTVIDNISSLNTMPLIPITGNLVLSSFLDNTELTGDLESSVEVFNFETIAVSESASSTSYRSFKTKANHDFGVVFYDQRGRSSDVVPIGSVYVPDYSIPYSKGPVEISINLTSTPPSWAWSYQIVYGGNSTVSDFIQYTAGGAFVEFDPENINENGNIYVSLNYLQKNKDVSYSNAFGAINYDGNKDFYTYKEGDKLRIISYFTDNDTRVYPAAYEFDVVGTVTLANDDDNPLLNPEGSFVRACTGQFVILRNNPNAFGFNYQSVKNAIINNNPSPETTSHFWNNRCLFELYSPLKSQDAEDRVYYEISKKYRIIRDQSNASLPINWENNNIVLSRGDVYFRRVAVNLPRWAPVENLFKNIITNNSNNTPRFLDYWIETKTFTDQIIGANQYDWGKPKIVNKYQRQIRRDSSITFSDVNNYALPRLLYTSFDATTSNFKDIQNSFGSIQSIVDRGDSLFVIQENKCSSIPVSRNIISDVSGTEIISASEKTLGSQIFYQGNYGCSDNPESVAAIGSSIYFANKDNQEVYKFNPSNGVSVISEYGLKNFFRNLFSSVISNESSGRVRVVGGHDPLLDEYVISVYNQTPLVYSGDSFIDQDVVTPTPDAPVGDEEAITQEDLDQLILQNLNLQQDLSDAQDTITDLQSTIINLYNQIGVVINTTGISEEDAAQEILELNEEINEYITQIDANQNFLLSQIQSAVSFHNNARRSAKTAEENGTNFISSINSLTNDNGVNRFENDTFTIPATISSIFTSSTGYNPGDNNVPYQSYLEVVQNIVNKLKEYDYDTQGGVFITTIGEFTTRIGDNVTFEIGYGIPTNDSTTDEYENTLPPDSILFSNENFLSELLDNNGYISQVTQMIQFFGVGEVLEDKLVILEDENEQLENDKQSILEQLATFVTGLYDSKGPSINKPDISSTDLFPFGVSYVDGNGNTVNPLQDLKNAVDLDEGTGGYYNLFSHITQNPYLLEDIKSAIEGGILGYRNVYQSEYDSSLDEISVLTIARDVLATNVYSGLNSIYNLLDKPQIGDVLPASIGSLITQDGLGYSNVAQILLGLDTNGDGQITPEDLIGANDIANEFSDDVDSIIEQIDVALDELRNPLLTFFTNTSVTADKLGLGSSLPANWNSTLQNSNNVNDFISVIEAWDNLLNSELDDGQTITNGITNLKNVLDTALNNLTIGGVSYVRPSIGDVESAISSGVNNPFLLKLNNLNSIAEDIEIAVSSLRDFQNLFGSLDGKPINAIGETVPVADGSLASYTGSGGLGLKASDLLNLTDTTFNGNPVNILVGLQNALASIQLRIDQMYESNTTYFDADSNLVALEGDGSDILPQTIYNVIYEAISSSIDPEETIIGEDEAFVQVQKIVQAANDAISGMANTLISNDIVSSRKDDDNNAIGYGSSGAVLADYGSLSPIGSFTFGGDYNKDTEVGTADLLAFLSAFGLGIGQGVIGVDGNPLNPNRLRDVYDDYSLSVKNKTLEKIRDSFGVSELTAILGSLSNVVTITQDESTGLFSAFDSTTSNPI